MFELGVLALSRAVEQGVFSADWELNGIGTVEGERRIAVIPEGPYVVPVHRPDA